MKYFINTDGGARGNPGPAGIGIVIRDGEGKLVKEFGKFIGKATNNFAEYSALIHAFDELKKLVSKDKRANAEFEFRLDSELVVKQLKGEYQISEETLFPFFIKVHNYRIKEFPNVRFVHVPRAENARADELVNEAVDSAGK